MERLERWDPESRQVESFSYNESGRLSQWEHRIDGALVRSETIQYEPGTMQSAYSAGESRFVTVTTFDEAGRWLPMDQRYGEDHTLITARRTGMLIGQLQRSSTARGDGAFYLDCYEHDYPTGVERGTTTMTYDERCDGEPESVETVVFGDTGQRLEVSRVTEWESSRERYTYDTRDNLIVRESNYGVESNHYEVSGLGVVFPEVWDF